MLCDTQRRPARGFTLIELMVAIGISVLLLSILAFVFKISTQATRAATSQVSLTERMRILNIRMRQEIGAMLPVQRLDPGTSKPHDDKRTFEVTDNAGGATDRGPVLKFASATVEEGLPVSVDVKYEFIQDPGGDVTKNVLIRWRDMTGPYQTNVGTGAKEINPNYKLGDDKWMVPTDGSTYSRADVLVSNVRNLYFTAKAMDIPPGMPGNSATASPTDLNPRMLPAGIQMFIEYGPETGNLDMVDRAMLYFPVYRGL
jgi:prepilin-type N-terminal cleavage/methylation domain-containing protein